MDWVSASHGRTEQLEWTEDDLHTYLYLYYPLLRERCVPVTSSVGASPGDWRLVLDTLTLLLIATTANRLCELSLPEKPCIQIAVGG